MLFISKNYKYYVNSNFLDKSLDAKSISILDLEASFQNAFGGALINGETMMIVILECMGSIQKFCK